MSMTTPPRILLLVEADLRASDYLAGHLRRAGHLVSVATDPREAVAALDRPWPDLIVMELDLPRDGRTGVGPADQTASGHPDHHRVSDRHQR